MPPQRPEAVSAVARLTTREREILRLVMLGYTSKAIGLRLEISPGTVDNRIKSCLAKLGLSDRSEAARLLYADEREKGVQWQDLQSLDLLIPNPSAQKDGVELSDDGQSEETEMVEDERSVVPADPFRLPQRYEHPADGRRTVPTVMQTIWSAVMIAAATAVLVLVVFACSDALTRIVWRVALRPS